MSLYHSNEYLPIEEAKKRNKENAEFRYKNQVRGCVSCRYCVNCGLLVHDTLCMCIGNFTCPGCNFKNGVNWSKIPVIDYNDNFIYMDNNIKYPCELEYYL